MLSWRIEEHASLASTQDELRKRLNAGNEVAGLVIRAARQSAGRGQRARDWFSAEGGSWQSAALRGSVSPGVALFMGIGIAQAFQPVLDPDRLLLKWPNDLLYRGRKAGGI